MNNSFEKNKYTIKRNFFSFFWWKFKILDEEENLLFYSEMKAFKLKEDIKIFSDETMVQELLRIKARSIIDFSATYDVFDSLEDKKIGSFKRKWLKSIFKDEWIFLDINDNEVWLIKEDSTGLALLRRWTWLLWNILFPQKYIWTINEQKVCLFKQNSNPFVHKINLDYSDDIENILDRRLWLAAWILLCAIEGKQK